MLFVVVNGTPSIGKMVMIGNGRIGTQTVRDQAILPPNSGWSAGGSIAATPSASASGGAISGLISAPTVAADAQQAASSASTTHAAFSLLVLALLSCLVL